MNEIWILQSKEKSYFGDKEEVWVTEGWTDDIRVARDWNISSHMMLRKQSLRVKKMTNEKGD
jgi:hypothetical protein